MKERVKFRGGILRMSALSLMHTFSNFINKEARLMNKNLTLRSIRRLDGDIPMLSTYYDFIFMGDDLPVIQEGCYPGFVIMEKVKGKGNCYRLVPDPHEHKEEVK